MAGAGPRSQARARAQAWVAALRVFAYGVGWINGISKASYGGLPFEGIGAAF